MKDPHEEVRAAAASSLGALGAAAADQSIPALLEAMKDQNAMVRSYAAWALGEMGPSNADAAKPALVAAMADPDPEVGSAAGASILKLQGQAVPGLPAESENP
jgi:HEAT repeat protein